MRSFLLLTALAAGTAVPAAAQLAVQQPTEKLLIVPLPVAGGADSLTSLRVMDATRERVDKLARYKVLVISKQKICEALSASGFSCDGLMDNQQTRQLARFLDADAYLTGVVAREAGALSAQLRVLDVGGSGFAYAFSARDANPGVADGLAEVIAQRLNTIIRAAERARECQMQRQRGQFSRALESARKALEAEPNLPAAHLCTATVYEAQRLAPDSLIAAARRALKGDSLNTHAWELIARQHQIKGDTASAVGAFRMLLRGDPGNKPMRLGLATTMQLRKQYAEAAELLQEGLEQSPGDKDMRDRLKQICIDGGLWRCVLDLLNQEAGHDATVLADTATLKIAIGAAQQISDTQALDRYTAEAVRQYPREVSFMKTRGSAFELRGHPDSAIVWYQRAYRADTTDVANALLIAKTIIESSTWDTTGAGPDSAALAARRAALGDRMETARPFLNRGVASADTAIRINTAVMLLTGGSKLAQAAAYDRAYAWLDQLLTLVAPRSPADTVGPRHQIRVNASFWYGLSSVLTLRGPYQRMLDAKSCSQAAEINQRMQRTRSALELGRRVHEPTVRQMLDFLSRFEANMPRAKQAFRCRNF